MSSPNTIVNSMMVISPVDPIPSPTVGSPEDPIPNSKPNMQSPLFFKNFSYHGKERKMNKTSKKWTSGWLQSQTACDSYGRG